MTVNFDYAPAGTVRQPTLDEVLRNPMLKKRNLAQQGEMTPAGTPLLDTAGLDQTGDVGDILQGGDHEQALDLIAEKHPEVLPHIAVAGETIKQGAIDRIAQNAGQAPSMETEIPKSPIVGQPETPHGNALDRMFSNRNLADFGLPILGVIESIATQGRSPGNAALAQQKLVNEREVANTERQTAEQEQRAKAIERQQKQSYTKAISSIDWTKPNANKLAIQKALEYGNIEDASRFANMKNQVQLSPEQVDQITKQYSNNPVLVADILSNPEKYGPIFAKAQAENAGKATQPITPEEQAKLDLAKKEQEQKAAEQKWKHDHFGGRPIKPILPGQAAPVSKEQFAHEQELAKRYDAGSTEYKAVKASYDMLKSAASGPQSPGSDAQFLSAYRRMVNPQAKRHDGNVGEDETYAGGMINRVQHAIAKVANGQLIDAGVKKLMIADAERLWQTHVRNQSELKKSFATQAQGYGLDPERVTASVSVPTLEESLPTYTPQQAAALPPGTRFKGTNGKIYTK
jgi:hypothetical protein